MSPQHYRRVHDLKSKYREHRVSDDPEHNHKLEQPTRLRNLEHDIVLNTSILGEIVAQNAKYADYLESLIEREKDAVIFWKDIRKKLAVSGIWGAVLLIGAVLWYAATHYVRDL